MRRLILMACASAAVPLPALALTVAASETVAREIESACGGAGRYDPAYVLERDLDGDGLADLVVAHEGIECAITPRSGECDEMLCPIRAWLHRGHGFTLALDDARGYDMTIGHGTVPEIRWVGDGGAPGAVRWDGSGFR